VARKENEKETEVETAKIAQKRRNTSVGRNRNPFEKTERKKSINHAANQSIRQTSCMHGMHTCRGGVPAFDAELLAHK